MTVDFMQMMQRERTQIENSNSDDSRPKTKNDILRINKNTPTLLLRFLPSVGMIKGDPQATLAVTQRNIMFLANSGTKEFTAGLTLPSVVDFDNPVEQKVGQWLKEEKLWSEFSGKRQKSKVRATHWLNVLKVVQDKASGTMTYEFDETGSPKVFALSVPDSGYNAIITQISDPLNLIDGQPIVSFGRSMPTQLAKPTQTTFSANVYQQPGLALPALDAKTIAAKLDTFEEITKPSNETQEDFFESIVGFVDGDGAGAGITNPANNYAQPTQPASQGAPDPFGVGNINMSDIPDPFSATAPVQQPDPFANAPVNAPVQQPQQNVAPQPQAPVQQQQASMPAQPQAPAPTQPEATNVMAPTTDLDSFLDNL